MRGSPAAFESFLAEAREDTAKADGLRLRRRAKPLSLFPRKKRKRFLMVSREKGLAAAFRTSSGTRAAPVTGAWPSGNLRALPIQPNMEREKAGGISGCPQLLFLLPHPGGCGRLAVGKSQMPRRPLLLPHPGGCGGPGNLLSIPSRVAHSEAECAGVEGQALRSSTPR